MNNNIRCFLDSNKREREKGKNSKEFSFLLLLERSNYIYIVKYIVN